MVIFYTYSFFSGHIFIKNPEGGIFIYPSPFYYRGRYGSRRRKPGPKFLFILLAVLLVIGGTGLFTRSYILPCLHSGMDRLADWITRNPEQFMRAAMPVISLVETEKVMAARYSVTIPRLPGIDLRGPGFILRSGIPLLGQVKEPPESAPVLAPPPQDKPGEEEKKVTLTKDCLVAIYNTHTGETYALTDGVSYLDGKRGGVTVVAGAMKKALEEKYGIRTVYSDHINDTIYDKSYIESHKTVEKLIAAHPKLKVVLDIHRDSHKSRELSAVKVNGRMAARILIVVGSDARAPFPNWEENRDFAQLVSDRMEKSYPGLSLGVRVKEGRYNQYLHPCSLLLEIGTENNTTEEAVYSAELLAGILAEIIAPDV